jgi:hypothetical protein
MQLFVTGVSSATALDTNDKDGEADTEAERRPIAAGMVSRQPKSMLSDMGADTTAVAVLVSAGLEAAPEEASAVRVVLVCAFF